MLVVRDASEARARARLGTDPRYRHGILRLVAVKRWDSFIAQRA